jgi:hypothetical protein
VAEEATPADAAVRLPVIEKHGCPYVETTFGDGFKTLAMVNTAGFSVAVQRPFLKRHVDQLWQGPARSGKVRQVPASAGNAVFYQLQSDDDGLPVDNIVEDWPSGRWLMVGCGGSHDMHALTLNPINKLSLGEVQIGYSLLRRRKALFDGPGKALWLKPATTVPEITLIRQALPAPSPDLLTAVLQSAIDCNDPVAVRALGAAGVDFKSEYALSRACSQAARAVAVALMEAGSPVAPPSGASGTPLLSACKTGDSVLIGMLLAKGADANQSNKFLFSAVLISLIRKLW